MPCEPSDLQAVLFDLDDTLNDRQRSWMAFVERMADPLTGQLAPCVVADVHRKIIVADENGYREKDLLFDDLSRLPWKAPTSAGEVEKLWREHFPSCMVTRAGVLAVLERLRELGVRTGIVTNGRADAQQAKLRKMGLQGVVDGVITSGGIGFKKPDPRIYAAALSELRVTASGTLFVGDNPQSDVVGPAKAGMLTAWLANGRNWLLPGAQPDYTLASFVELRGRVVDAPPAVGLTHCRPRRASPCGWCKDRWAVLADYVGRPDAGRDRPRPGRRQARVRRDDDDEEDRRRRRRGGPPGVSRTVRRRLPNFLTRPTGARMPDAPNPARGRIELRHTMLPGSVFHGVCFGEAVFQDVNLGKATFGDINLSHATVENVNLSHARFRDIDLTGTTFDDVNLTGVVITNADVTGMRINGVLVSDLLAGHERGGG